MESLEIKLGLHKMIDELKNEQLLMSVYEFLKNSQNKEKSIWETLSANQKKEVMLAFEESENPENLLEKDAFFRKN